MSAGLGAGERVALGGGSSGDGFLGNRGMAASKGEAATALGTVPVDNARLRSMDLRSLDLLPLFSVPIREVRRSSIASNGSRVSSGTESEGVARRWIELRNLDLLPLFSGPVREASRASITSIEVPPSSLCMSSASNGSRDGISVGLVVRGRVNSDG